MTTGRKHTSLLKGLLVVAALPVVGTPILAACSNESKPHSVAEGRDLYTKNCSSCHGTDARGTGAASALNPAADPGRSVLTDPQIREAVRKGADSLDDQWPAMPAMPAVSGSDLDSLIAYLDSLNTTRP
jgi:mono/diheme cytochrome c family protein